MKKILILFIFSILLTGCTIDGSFTLPFNTNTNELDQTTTEPNIAQLSEEDLENIKQQVMNEIRQEIQEQFSQSLTDIEHLIINSVKMNADAVLGVSNYNNSGGILLEASTGSGVIYKHVVDTSTYFMITNEHVVNGANKIRVVLADQSTIDAELVGADPRTDLAVIKFVSSISFPTVEIADSDNLQIGQFAIAIGNPLGYEYYGSVTSGIVSGLSRNMEIDYDNDDVIDWRATLIQHDAAISPGNSGGGLFDINGKLIGINNMKIVQDTVSNIGFAIPSNTVKYVTEQLELYGEIKRPSLGIQGLGVTQIIQNNAIIQARIDAGLNPGGEIVPLPDDVTSGVYVFEITPDSSVDGLLQEDDIITKYNDVHIFTFEDLRIQIENALIGDEITLTVYRDGNLVEIPSIILKALPETE